MKTVVIPKNSVAISEKDVQLVIDLSNGKLAREIASKRKCSVRTIESRVAYLREVYGCNTIGHLVATFLRQQLIK